MEETMTQHSKSLQKTKVFCSGEYYLVDKGPLMGAGMTKVLGPGIDEGVRTGE